MEVVVIRIATLWALALSLLWLTGCSKESQDDAARLESERVWIVDPLDGTREFIAGRPEFAVSVALAFPEAAVTEALQGAPVVSAKGDGDEGREPSRTSMGIPPATPFIPCRANCHRGPMR